MQLNGAKGDGRAQGDADDDDANSEGSFDPLFDDGGPPPPPRSGSMSKKRIEDAGEYKLCGREGRRGER